jgi:hypothetical protein
MGMVNVTPPPVRDTVVPLNAIEHWLFESTAPDPGVPEDH